ncbi:hypothetical protein JCM8097_007129 [Rhodosporidiobolus ruineniae]
MPAHHKGKRTHPADTAIQLPPGPASSKSLARLNQHRLANFAQLWLTEQPRTAGRLGQDSDDADEDEDGLEDVASRRAYYLELSEAEGNTARSRVVKAIQEDWRDGLSYRQVAQVDLEHFKEKGTGRSWTAFQANLAPSASISASNVIFERFSTAFRAYHSHYLHLSTITSPSPATLLRIQLLPSSSSSASSSSSSTTHPAPIYLLHLPLTPFVLLPSSLSSTYAPIIKQCLLASLSSPPATELAEIPLRGKDWAGLRELLLQRGSAVGVWRTLREGNGREKDGGGVLVPKERRRKREKPDPIAQAENDPTRLPPTLAEKRQARTKRQRTGEIADVWGGEAGEVGLPVLERLEYTVDLPYPSLPRFSPPSTASTANALPFPHNPSHPPLTLRFEGAHVLSGLRSLVAHGLTEEDPKKAEGGKGRQKPGLPSWLGEMGAEGVSRMRVERRRDGTVGRV